MEGLSVWSGRYNPNLVVIRSRLSECIVEFSAQDCCRVEDADLQVRV